MKYRVRDALFISFFPLPLVAYSGGGICLPSLVGVAGLMSFNREID